MRRVRCDLKDLQASSPSTGLAACSNCKERGLRCVDEFQEIKAVKALRRGRRLQVVEAVYGKQSCHDDLRRPLASPQASSIPRLRSEFFSSPFFQAFITQRPIIDLHEISLRFLEAHNGNTDALGVTGQLLCMVLAIWAASFGVNEMGEPDSMHGHHVPRLAKERTNSMTQELLQLIDMHGVLRKPTWDGVRVLLLLVPLTEDFQSPLERLAMYEVAVNQVYALCSLVSVSSMKGSQGDFVDATVRARIFWYAHVHEGITTGLRGGRLLLSDDDLEAFETTTLPLIGSQSAVNYQSAYRYSRIPLRISTICRQVHASLTGSKARQSDEIDAFRLHEVWNSLGHVWEDLDGLRNYPGTDALQPHEIERFISGWQIKIFECLNVIKDALKQRMVACTEAGASFLSDGQVTRSPRLAQIQQLHAHADDRCQHFAHLVVQIVRKLLGNGVFEYDASLVRDGCFYAGVSLAGESGTEDEVKTCIQALREMRWAFSKSDEREHTLKMVWDQRISTERRRLELRRNELSIPDSTSTSPFTSPDSVPDFNESHSRFPPPLLISHTTRGLHDSAPNTAGTEDGWTVASNASFGTHSHRSSSGSPQFIQPQKVEVIDSALILAPVGEQTMNAPVYCHQISDTFAFSIAPSTTSAPRSPHEITPPCSSAGLSTSSVSYQDTYLDPSGPTLFSVSPPGSARGVGDASTTTPLPLDKNAPYHVSYNGGQFFTTP